MSLPVDQWWHQNPKIPYGVVVGFNWGMEVLLPWWWQHYSRHNSFPVTFFDLGMTPAAARFCKERGSLIKVKIPFSFLSKRMDVPSHWEKRTREEGIYYLNQYRRLSWFKKPFCLLHTPYQNTVWLDLDCQVRADLFDLFLYAENDQGIGLAPTDEMNASFQKLAGWDVSLSHHINSGVIVYKHGCSTIKAWVESIKNWDLKFYGDQDLLAEILHRENKKLEEVPRIYNWRVNKWGENPSSFIAHYAGDARKLIL